MQAPAHPPLKPAAAAGLRYSSDANPGISRRRCGRGMAYHDARGQPLREARVLARIRALAIPPAWRAVWICPDAAGHLQATGRDARGRKQYRYHADWQKTRGAHKFDQLRRFGRLLPAIRQRVRRALGAGDQPTRSRVLATLVRLLDATAARIGNTAYARDNGSFGLSTLRRQHVRCEGDDLRLRYSGKSGVQHAWVVTDRRVAAVVRRCRELPGQLLFSHVDADGSVHAVDSGDVNDWLSQGPAGAGLRITAKHFRTWHASVMALDLVLAAAARAGPPPGSPAPATATGIVAAVARRLGNTPAVCRQAYIHPAVLGLLQGLDDPVQCAAVLAARWARQPPALAGLARAERQLMGLLAAVDTRPSCNPAGKAP